MTVAGPIYRIGTVLLDLEQPHKVVARCNKPILSPREDYERIGDVGNVVFACGAVVEDTGEMNLTHLRCGFVAQSFSSAIMMQG